MHELRFLFGHAGSGKTRLVEEEMLALAARGETACLLVPEQQAYIAERDFLPRLPADCHDRITIYSFSRLAGAVFAKYGGVTAQKPSRGIKTLLMWQTLRSLDGILQTYRGRSDPALAEMMLEATEELRNSGITSEILEDARSRLPSAPALANKLSDLALIHQAYNMLLATKYNDRPDDLLLVLANTLQKHVFFENTHVFVDSFTSFTAPERRVLGEIMRQASAVTLTLGICGLGERGIQYDSLRETAQKLTLDANRAGIPIKQTLLPDAGIGRAPLLRALSESLWQFDAPPLSYEPTDSAHLRMISAPHIYAEADAVALEILRLKKEGIEFGEIAVITRDPQMRKGILDAALERYGIPCFLSERTDLRSQPAARLLLSALRAVTHNWQAEDLITLAKTGLCGTAPDDVDLFEDYCNTWHLRGAAFEAEVWSMNPDGYTPTVSARAGEILRAANRVREQLMTPLSTLALELRMSETVREKCAALYRYTQTVGLSDRLADLAAQELENGQVRRAGELVRLYDTLVELLAELGDLLGSERMPTEDFSAALSLLLGGTDIGSVPAMHDCVVIGSAATVRVENIRAVITPGLCEGDFPHAVTSRGLFSESERRLLASLSITPGQSRTTASSDELYYVYRAFSKPRDVLVLLLPTEQPDGKPLSPGTAWSRVRALVPDCPISVFTPLSQTPPPLAAPAPTAAPDFAAERTRKLLGDTLLLSQSGLHTFVSCPYRFYCERVLRLRSQAPARVSFDTAGNLIHYILEQALSALRLPDGGLLQIDGAERQALTDQLTDRYVRLLCAKPLSEISPRLAHQFSRLQTLSDLLLESTLNELANSDFRPIAFEQSFGQKNDPLDAPCIPLDDSPDAPRIRLCGKMDRIDRWQDGDKTYLRVVDYKSGEVTFRLDRYLRDADFQLPIYLFTAALPQNAPFFAAAETTVQPAGAVYLYTAEVDGKPTARRSGILLSEPRVLQAVSHTMDAETLCGIKCKKDGSLSGNLSDADAMAQMERETREAVRQIGVRIYSGCAERTPGEENCRFCSLADRCPLYVKPKM